MVPLDAPLPAQTTVGGILAANASGALRVRYGSARDIVIGMQIAMTDGQLVKGGGQVVKNVAGYDLPKLFIGSLGTLGVITEATFKVVPLPQQTGTLVAAFSNFADASAVALHVLQSKLLPLGIEVLNRAASAELGLGNAYTLVVRFGGNPRELARQLGDVQKWAGENSSITNDDAALWSRLRDFIFENKVVLKISVQPTRVAEISARVEQLAGKYRAGCWVQAHAFGIVYTALSGDAERIAPMIEELRAHAQVTIQRAPRGLREKVDAWGPTKNDLPLMQKLKREFDPTRVLNPGRFVGGI
jgi:glycolate oxidase FAD binding subunit